MVGLEIDMVVTEMGKLGIILASVTDPFGHHRLLHQIERVVNFEERSRLFE